MMNESPKTDEFRLFCHSRVSGEDLFYKVKAGEGTHYFDGKHIVPLENRRKEDKTNEREPDFIESSDNLATKGSQ